ncbi:hypothetical protein GEMRC1_004579 [Eukaryota sp. GEM-RC1]
MNEKLLGEKSELEMETSKKLEENQSYKAQVQSKDDMINDLQGQIQSQSSRSQQLSLQITSLESKLSATEQTLQIQQQELLSVRHLQDENAKLKGRLFDSMEKIKELETSSTVDSDASPLASSLQQQLKAKEDECQQLFIMCENIVKEMEETTRKNKVLEEKLNVMS